LVKVFEGNFKGTYVCPGNSWDLRSYKQKSDESLHDYIRRFSKQRTELPNITDSNVIITFLSRSTYKELAQELGHNTLATANELMDIITSYATGEEVVGAIFGGDQDKGKRKDEDPESSNWGTKRNNRKKKKKKKNQQGKREAMVDDLVVAADRKKPRGPSVGASSTRCSKNHVPTTRDPRTTTSRIATCFRGTSKAWLSRRMTRRRTPRRRTATRMGGFPRSTTAS
jgi:hypothetical protein